MYAEGKMGTILGMLTVINPETWPAWVAESAGVASGGLWLNYLDLDYANKNNTGVTITVPWSDLITALSPYPTNLISYLNTGGLANITPQPSTDDGMGDPSNDPNASSYIQYSYSNQTTGDITYDDGYNAGYNYAVNASFDPFYDLSDIFFEDVSDDV